MTITVRPLTPGRWPDFEAVFEAKGCSIARGCWCMYYRESGKEALPPGVKPPEVRKARMKALVESGPPPGLIGYSGRTPVGRGSSPTISSCSAEAASIHERSTRCGALGHITEKASV